MHINPSPSNEHTKETPSGYVKGKVIFLFKSACPSNSPFIIKVPFSCDEELSIDSTVKTGGTELSSVQFFNSLSAMAWSAIAGLRRTSLFGRPAISSLLLTLNDV